MIKSTKTSIKFSNKQKLSNIHAFLVEYHAVIHQFVNLLWDIPSIQSLVPKHITDQADTWLSARAVQCAGKQASAIVRGCKKKQSKRLYQINKFKKQGEHKKARKLQHIYDNIKLSKPDISKLSAELDARFVKIDLDNKTSFDGWLTLTSLGRKLNLKIPFKRTKHFNKMLKLGTLKTGVRLSADSITLMFDIEVTTKKAEGKIIGIDIGQTTILTCSDGQTIEADTQGHTFKSICNKLANKKKGSKNFEQASTHRKNFSNWSINQLNLAEFKQVNLENIKYLRRGHRTTRRLSHWNYAELFEGLESKLNDAGVQIIKVSPTYTSQRCSACGWVRKRNRNGKQFKCDKCSFELDADLNGSINISLNLLPIKKQDRLSRVNRSGFYWPVIAEERIVPQA